jgi:hypothetical protein
MATLPDQLGNPWRTPGVAGYVAETEVFNVRGSIELGARPDGRIDLVVSLDGEDFTLWGLRKQEIAELGAAMVRAAATAPGVVR